MTSQLRTLLDDVADPALPVGLAERAVAQARRRRARRWAVGGSVLGAAALVLGALVVVRPAPDAAPRPVDVASLPVELPAPEGLPTLAEAPMGSATAAYAVSGELALVSAADAHAALLPADGSGLRDGVVQVSLSPDGRWAVVVRAWAPTVDASGPALSLLDVAAGRETPLEGVTLGWPFAGSGWLQPQLVAWAPDGRWFACACTAKPGAPGVWLVPQPDAADGVVDDASRLAVEAAGLSWGAAGLAVRESADAGRWVLVPYHQLPGGHGGPPGWPELADDAAAVALSRSHLNGFLTAGPDRYVVWSSLGEPIIGSLDGDRLAFVGQAAGGYLLATRPAAAGAGEPPPPAPLDVRTLSGAGSLRDLTRLPAGTTSASFAAALVGSPRP